MSLQRPLVSIVTPAFNVERFIGDAIRSVLGQTFTEFELLIVDDASTDSTAEAVRTHAGTDSRVRVLRHPSNRGPWAARNTAIDAARGRYIAFLDSDDWWLERKLEEQLVFMRDSSAVISYTGFAFADEDGEALSDTITVPGRLDYFALLKNTVLRTSSVIVDRAATGPFQMKPTYYDDLALWFELLRRGFVAQGLNRDLMRYRLVRGSLSWNKLRSAWHVWEVFRDVEGLGLCRALWFFAHYAWNAARKYRGPRGRLVMRQDLGE